MTFVWLGGIVRTRAARFFGTVASVALAVLIVAALGAFFSSAKARMTATAARGVPVDWQVRLAPGTNVEHATETVRRTGDARDVLAVGYGAATSFEATVQGSTQTTGPGMVLGLPSEYPVSFPREIRILVGRIDGVTLAQQTAANLHAAVGSRVLIGRPGLRAAPVVVGGIVDLPNADAMFQVPGTSPGAGPSAPPDNVVLLPLGTWHRLFDPVSIGRPGAVTTQLHVRLATRVPSDPGAAFAQVQARARHLEAQLAGAGSVGDNLAAQLDAARTDAVYAQLLFVFLGIPGAVVAALVAAVIAASGRERRRRELSLLRIRGTGRRAILRLAAAEALATGTLGGVTGLGVATVVGRAAFGSARFGATSAQAIAWIAAAAATGIVLAVSTILIPAWNDAGAPSLAGSRTAVAGNPRPLWARLYVDLLLLLVAGGVYWQAVRSGYQVVIAPEGVPTISVSTFTLLAPMTAWIGSALLIWRLASWTLARGGRVISALARPLVAGLARTVAASLARQRRLLSKTLVITALAASFAVSTAVFNGTYAAQARVDAQLTNGADVCVSTSAAGELAGAVPATVRRVPGVSDAEPMQHRFAYVGNDLQDLYGIDPARIARATAMSDAFFAGGSASRSLAALASHPDGILVSDETVRDFQLHAGDLVRLRLQFAGDGSYHVVAFRFIGVVREFPTAPHDSFLVANATYVARATGRPGVQTMLIRTAGSPPAVAARIRALFGPATGVTVSDVEGQLRSTLSSLTAIDLSGLTRLQLGFAVALAAAASGLVLWLGLAERRRMFAIAYALGARPRQIAGFVWSEATVVTVGGIVSGALAGATLAYVIVKILTGVFDPPPEHLVIPWKYLGLVAGAALAAIVAAGTGALRAARRQSIVTIRDL